MVAIVMRTYERPVLLARAIANVQNQTFSDWEPIIVNNGGDPSGVESVVSVARTSTGTSKFSVLHLPDCSAQTKSRKFQKWNFCT